MIEVNNSSYKKDPVGPRFDSGKVSVGRFSHGIFMFVVPT